MQFSSPTHIRSLDKFEEPNIKCSQRKFKEWNIKFRFSPLDSHLKAMEVFKESAAEFFGLDVKIIAPAETEIKNIHI